MSATGMTVNNFRMTDSSSYNEFGRECPAM